jgi:hypothetical protein
LSGFLLPLRSRTTAYILLFSGQEGIIYNLIMEYKGIKYSIYPELSALAVKIDSKNEGNEIENIIKASTLTELIGYVNPVNVIIDRREAERLPAFMVDFLKNQLFKDLLDYGVKHIVYLLPKEEVEYADRHYKDRPEYVILMENMDEVYEYLRVETHS